MKGLISLPTHLPVSKVLSLVWCEDVIRKAWHDLLSGEAPQHTVPQKMKLLRCLKGNVGLDFCRLVAKLDVLLACFGVAALSVWTTQRRQRLFFLKYLMVSADVQMFRQYRGRCHSLHALSSCPVFESPSLPPVRDSGLIDVTHCQISSSS